jgi:hypothetical protein
MTPIQQREASEADSASVEIRFRGQKIIILRLAEQFWQSSRVLSTPDAARSVSNGRGGNHHGGCNKPCQGLCLPRSFFGEIAGRNVRLACRFAPRWKMLVDISPQLSVEQLTDDT